MCKISSHFCFLFLFLKIKFSVNPFFSFQAFFLTPPPPLHFSFSFNISTVFYILFMPLEIILINWCMKWLLSFLNTCEIFIILQLLYAYLCVVTEPCYTFILLKGLMSNSYWKNNKNCFKWFFLSYGFVIEFICYFSCLYTFNIFAILSYFCWYKRSWF